MNPTIKGKRLTKLGVKTPFCLWQNIFPISTNLASSHRPFAGDAEKSDCALAWDGRPEKVGGAPIVRSWPPCPWRGRAALPSRPRRPPPCSTAPWQETPTMVLHRSLERLHADSQWVAVLHLRRMSHKGPTWTMNTIADSIVSYLVLHYSLRHVSCVAEKANGLGNWETDCVVNSLLSQK